MIRNGYQGFGSFHSDNVEELVRLSDEQFALRCPPMPFECPLSEYISRTEGMDNGGCCFCFSLFAGAGDPPMIPIMQWLTCATEICSDGSSTQVKALGHAARKHFLIDFDSWTFLNHGAFGAVSRYAYEVSARWRERCESQPLRFLDRREGRPCALLSADRLPP